LLIAIAWKALSLLNSVSSLINSKSKEPLLKIVDQIQRIYLQISKTDPSTAAQFYPIYSEFSVLLSSIIGKISDSLLPNRWQFIFQRLEDWISVIIPFSFSFSFLILFLFLFFFLKKIHS